MLGDLITQIKHENEVKSTHTQLISSGKEVATRTGCGNQSYLINSFPETSWRHLVRSVHNTFKQQSK
ncbi:MAG: hypothetical protein AYK19_06230 [Theionarchaea archaeon DG-70-1]|nr:MAG: hypothetical protein AYK19_06230 [Theionarchaea archaeon DG-70-1]